MWLTVFFCLPGALSQAIFSLGVSAGDNGANQGYQPLLPQTTYVQPYSSGAVPMPVSSYPIGVGMGYPSSYGMGIPISYGSYPMGGYSGYSSGYPVYEMHRPEGPMKRFWRGAADGVVQGSLGWLG